MNYADELTKIVEEARVAGRGVEAATIEAEAMSYKKINERIFKAVANYVANVLKLDRSEIFKLVEKRIDHIITKWLETNLDHGWFGQRIDNAVRYAVERHVSEAFRLATAQAVATMDITFGKKP